MFIFLEHQDPGALAPRKAADARTYGYTGAKPRRLVHVGEAGILDCLARRVDPVDDERVDLALDLMVDAFVGIEAIFVIGRLHLAGNAAFLIAGVELGDPPRAASAGHDVLPAGLHVAAERRHETETGNDYSAHLALQIDQQAQAPFGPSLSKPCNVLERI